MNVRSCRVREVRETCAALALGSFFVAASGMPREARAAEEEDDKVNVTVSSDDPSALVERRANVVEGWQTTFGIPVFTVTEQWEAVCATPSTMHAFRNAAYRVNGRGVATSHEFVLPKGNDVQLEVHSRAAFWYSTGVASAVIGGLFVLGGVISTYFAGNVTNTEAESTIRQLRRRLPGERRRSPRHRRPALDHRPQHRDDGRRPYPLEGSRELERGSVDAQHALLRRHAEAEREAVVAGAAVDVHAVGAARPEAVIGDALAEEAQERPREAEAEQPDLAAVGVAREDEVRLARREVLERARIVEEHDARRAGLARMLGAHRSRCAPRSLDAKSIPTICTAPASVSISRAVVDEELDAVLRQSARDDGLGRLVIVVAVAGEHPPAAGRGAARARAAADRDRSATPS